MNLYSAHMDPDDWQQPQQFRPERFLDESDNIIHRDRVIAFSLGKRRLLIELYNPLFILQCYFPRLYVKRVTKSQQRPLFNSTE